LRQIINIVESLQEKISGCGCEAAGTTGKNIAEQGNPQVNSQPPKGGGFKP